MSFGWKDKPITRRRFLGYVTAGLGAIISTLVKWPTGFWLVGTMLIVIAVAPFFAVPQTSTANADPEPTSTQDCLSCHTKVLKLHDKLGSGSQACSVCHGNPKMTMLRLPDGTQLPFSDAPRLCGQCHPERYNAWKEGTHGSPGVVATVKCTDCHDPHQPQIALLNITKPHPPPVPSPPPPSAELLVMLGISLLLMIAVGVAVMKQGEGP